MIDNVFDRFFDSLSVARISDVALGTETHNGAILKAAHIHIELKRSQKIITHNHEFFNTYRVIDHRSVIFSKKGSDKMINALVTKNGQSALISLPAKRIGLARDLASIGVASPPSELYPHDDEATVGLKYFGTDDFSGRLITLIRSEDSLARVNTLVELYGDLSVAQWEKVKASVLSGEMTSLNDFKNSILENKAPEIVQN